MFDIEFCDCQKLSSFGDGKLFYKYMVSHIGSCDMWLNTAVIDMFAIIVEMKGNI